MLNPSIHHFRRQVCELSFLSDALYHGDWLIEFFKWHRQYKLPHSLYFAQVGMSGPKKRLKSVARVHFDSSSCVIAAPVARNDQAHLPLWSASGIAVRCSVLLCAGHGTRS
ncbi:MAG: hypothetical protein J7K15_03935 [Deltaproteobacteria bacterium]|nr:hypothetical protein [Deltaproteobacteria bacterium]